MARPYVSRDGEGEALWFLGNLVTLKSTGAQTRGKLTVAEFVNPPGFAPPLHRDRVAPVTKRPTGALDPGRNAVAGLPDAPLGVEPKQEERTEHEEDDQREDRRTVGPGQLEDDTEEQRPEP